jgi:hypothetical protein
MTLNLRDLEDDTVKGFKEVCLENNVSMKDAVRRTMERAVVRHMVPAEVQEEDYEVGRKRRAGILEAKEAAISLLGADGEASGLSSEDE